MKAKAKKVSEPVSEKASSAKSSGTALGPQLDRLAALLEDDPENEAKDLICDVYRLLPVNGKLAGPFRECGSVSLGDTPKALYRVLFLFKPDGVDFSEMYKTQLLIFSDPTETYVATFELFKYEAALYFAARKEQVEGSGSAVIAGMPGADNGVRMASPEGKRWCEMLQRVLEHEWMVYGGNDFIV